MFLSVVPLRSSVTTWFAFALGSATDAYQHHTFQRFLNIFQYVQILFFPKGQSEGQPRGLRLKRESVHKGGDRHAAPFGRGEQGVLGVTLTSVNIFKWKT